MLKLINTHKDGKKALKALTANIDYFYHLLQSKLSTKWQMVTTNNTSSPLIHIKLIKNNTEDKLRLISNYIIEHYHYIVRVPVYVPQEIDNMLQIEYTLQININAKHTKKQLDQLIQYINQATNKVI